jgi:hypothetical protein
MKQTAVDWIVSKLSITFQTMYSEEIEQAKEMEKEQIKDSYEEGYSDGYPDNGKSGEQYYNETYGDK